MVAAWLKAPQFPTNDPALFEYYGRHLLHGQRLYVDLWDNKLPSIYVVNEAWQWLFGDRYRLHLGIEMLINALSVGLFSALLRRHRLAGWPWATFCFAAILVLPPAAYDFTEFYALPLILGALLAFDLPLLAGACIALAATFWVPSLLVGIVFCRRRRAIAAFAAGVLAVAIPYAAAFVLITGAPTVAALAATWPAYIKQGGAALSTSRLGFLRALYAPAIISGAGACLAAFLTFIRRPNTTAQWLALGWICATLIGAVVPSHPSFHYFIPSLAALVFGIGAFARLPLERKTMVPRLIAALAAVWLLSRTAASVGVQLHELTTAALSARTIGACSDRTFGPNTVIYAAAFAPELYLAADAALGNRYAMIDPVLHMTQRMGVNVRPPQVFIGLAEDSPPQGYQLRFIAEPWRVFTPARVALTCPYRRPANARP